MSLFLFNSYLTSVQLFEKETQHITFMLYYYFKMLTLFLFISMCIVQCASEMQKIDALEMKLEKALRTIEQQKTVTETLEAKTRTLQAEMGMVLSSSKYFESLDLNVCIMLVFVGTF